MPNSDSKPKIDFKTIDLESYQKEHREKLDSWTTSVSLEKKHETFLNETNLNLSKLVRDLLDGLAEARKNRIKEGAK